MFRCVRRALPGSSFQIAETFPCHGVGGGRHIGIGIRGLTFQSMPTRFLIIGALLTALVILVGVGVWFLLGIL